MRNDFTKRECRIQEQMAEVFQRMGEDSTIEFPKPDLSFMEEGTVPGLKYSTARVYVHRALKMLLDIYNEIDREGV